MLLPGGHTCRKTVRGIAGAVEESWGKKPQKEPEAAQNRLRKGKIALRDPAGPPVDA
jgi:hypothetical protein